MSLSRFCGWALGTLPLALAMLIGAPVLLGMATIVLLVGPVARPEQLGVTLSIAATGLLVGVLALSDGGLDPLPWLAAAGAVSLLGITRLRIETHHGRFSSDAIRRRWTPGAHEAATAIALAATGSALMVSDGPAARANLYDAVPTVLLAAAPCVVAAAPLALRSRRGRAIAWTTIAIVFGLVASVPGLVLSFYYFPAALLLAAAAVAATIR